MARIKITGYINVEDLRDDEFDPNDRTGLTEEAHLKYMAGEDGIGINVHDLEDAEAELVEDDE